MPVLNQLKLPLLTALGESQVEENRPGYLGDRPRALGRYSRLGTVAGQSFRYTSNKTSLSGALGEEATRHSEKTRDWIDNSSW
jgi:hypothetical protein